MKKLTSSLGLGLLLAATLAAQDEAQRELIRHAEPSVLAPGAVSEDWPGFLGPRRDGISRETHLLDSWEAAGPQLLWELPIGSGFASPVVAQGRLVLTHRVGDREVVDCLAAESGQHLWRAAFFCDFQGEFIDDHGPRSTPFIDGDRVYVHAVGGVMRCLELESGKLLWESDWRAEFELPEAWFGVVSSPLVHGDLLIQNLGEPKAGSVAAFDKHTGKLVWSTAPRDKRHSAWGASCASPVIQTLGGRERLFVITGGKSKPPQGGLMVLDPKTGELQASHAFRSRDYYSVNGSSPLVVGDSVLLSASYGVGSRCLQWSSSGLAEASAALGLRWEHKRLGLQFGNPLHQGGRLFLADGAPGGVGALHVLDLESGASQAEFFLELSSTVISEGQPRELDSSTGEASLLMADGKLFCLGDDGSLFMLDVHADEPRVLAAAALFHARWAWTPPVITKGLLYVRQNTKDGSTGKSARLLCYDLRARD